MLLGTHPILYGYVHILLSFRARYTEKCELLFTTMYFLRNREGLISFILYTGTDYLTQTLRDEESLEDLAVLGPAVSLFHGVRAPLTRLHSTPLTVT